MEILTITFNLSNFFSTHMRPKTTTWLALQTFFSLVLKKIWRANQAVALAVAMVIMGGSRRRNGRHQFAVAAISGNVGNRCGHDDGMRARVGECCLGKGLWCEYDGTATTAGGLAARYRSVIFYVHVGEKMMAWLPARADGGLVEKMMIQLSATAADSLVARYRNFVFYMSADVP